MYLEARHALAVERLAQRAIVALEIDLGKAKSTSQRLKVARAISEGIDAWAKAHSAVVSIRSTRGVRWEKKASASDESVGLELAPETGDEPAAGADHEREPMDGDQAMGHDAEPSTGTNG